MSKLSLINSQSYYHWRLNEVKIHKHFHISKNVDLFSAHFFFAVTFWYTSSYIIGIPLGNRRIKNRSDYVRSNRYIFAFRALLNR